MSDSVVFARAVDGGWVPEEEVEGGRAGTGGAEGALVASAGDVGAIGLVELGRFVQASSSNPLGGGSAELDLAGGCTGVDDFVGDAAMSGETER
jgi:hypothetical protein